MFSAGGNYMWSITEILFWFFSLFKGEKKILQMLFEYGHNSVRVKSKLSVV